MIRYTTIDKTTWGPGPWQDEPDKVSWTDKATGLPCLIVRSEGSGSLCGYVGVGPEHALHGKNDSDYGYGLAVHGGITYTAACSHGDQAHSICHIPAPGQPDDTWWFGFDTAHCYDLAPRVLASCSAAFRYVQRASAYRDLAYVKAEVESLAQQLKAIVS